ncbi:2S seed storage protein-like protein [Tanacetum coccineum]
MVLLINGGHLVRSQNKVSSCNKLQSVDQQYQCASVHQVYRKAQQMQGQQDEVSGQQKIQQLRMKTYTDWTLPGESKKWSRRITSFGGEPLVITNGRISSCQELETSTLQFLPDFEVLWFD